MTYAGGGVKSQLVCIGYLGNFHGTEQVRSHGDGGAAHTCTAAPPPSQALSSSSSTILNASTRYLVRLLPISVHLLADVRHYLLLSGAGSR